MDMMEMMDDQDGRESIFFLVYSPLSFSLSLLDVPGPAPLSVSMAPSGEGLTPVRCSQQQSALCAVDDMYLSALQQ